MAGVQPVRSTRPYLLSLQCAPVALPALNLLFVLDGPAELGQTTRQIGVFGQEGLPGLLDPLQLGGLVGQLATGRLELVGTGLAILLPGLLGLVEAGRPPSAPVWPCAWPRARGPGFGSWARWYCRRPRGGARAAGRRGGRPSARHRRRGHRRPGRLGQLARDRSSSAERSGGSERRGLALGVEPGQGLLGDLRERPGLAALLAPGPGQAPGRCGCPGRPRRRGSRPWPGSWPRRPAPGRRRRPRRGCVHCWPWDRWAVMA